MSHLSENQSWEGLAAGTPVAIILMMANLEVLTLLKRHREEVFQSLRALQQHFWPTLSSVLLTHCLFLGLSLSRSVNTWVCFCRASQSSLLFWAVFQMWNRARWAVCLTSWEHWPCVHRFLGHLSQEEWWGELKQCSAGHRCPASSFECASGILVMWGLMRNDGLLTEYP